MHLLQDKCVLKTRGWAFKYKNKGVRNHSSLACVGLYFIVCLFLNPKRIMRATEIVLLLIWFLGVYVPACFCANVTYDHRALLIDGKRRVLISGSIHYPRSTPQVSFSICFSVAFIFQIGVWYAKCQIPLRLVSVSVWCLCLMFELNSGSIVVVVDVAGPYSEIQRWRNWCHWDLCFLEFARTGSRTGSVLFHCLSTFILFLCLFLHCILWVFRMNDGLHILAWQYNFQGRGDLVGFVKAVAAAGLYVHLRIGPYACAEWNYG